jgi:hypothetical protein
MQNADRSSSGRTRLLKGKLAVVRNSQDILAPLSPYSYKGAGSRVLVAIGGASDCCIDTPVNPNINPNITTPIITDVVAGDRSLSAYF